MKYYVFGIETFKQISTGKQQSFSLQNSWDEFIFCKRLEIKKILKG